MLDELLESNNETNPLVHEGTENNSYYKKCNTSVFRSIRNYFVLPRLYDWLIVGVVVVCVVATIVLICI